MSFQYLSDRQYCAGMPVHNITPVHARDIMHQEMLIHGHVHNSPVHNLPPIHTRERVYPEFLPARPQPQPTFSVGNRGQQGHLDHKPPLHFVEQRSTEPYRTHVITPPIPHRDSGFTRSYDHMYPIQPSHRSENNTQAPLYHSSPTLRDDPQGTHAHAYYIPSTSNRADTGIQPPPFNHSVPSCNRDDEYYAHPLARKYQLEFKNCYQQLTQTFEMFADELKFLASGAFPMYPISVVQCMLKAQFRIGLLKDSTIRDFPHVLDSCETIEEMVQQAVCHERERNEKLFSQLRQLYGIETATQGYNQPNEIKSETHGYRQPIEIKTVTQGFSQPNEIKTVTQGFSQPNEIKTVTQGFSEPNEVTQEVNMSQNLHQEEETQDNECAYKLKQSVSTSINQLKNLESLSNFLTSQHKSKDTVINGQVRYCPYTRTYSAKQNRPCKMKHCNKVTTNRATINEHNCDMTYTNEQLYLEDLFSEQTANKKAKTAQHNSEIASILKNTYHALAKLYATNSKTEQISIQSESENQNSMPVNDSENCDLLSSICECEFKSQINVAESKGSLLSKCQKELQPEIIQIESELTTYDIKSLQCKQIKQHEFKSENLKIYHNSENAQNDCSVSEINSTIRDIVLMQSQLLAALPDPESYSNEQIVSAQSCIMISQEPGFSGNDSVIDTFRCEKSYRETVVESVICDITYSDTPLYLDRLFSVHAESSIPVKEIGLISRPEFQSRAILKGHTMRQMISMTQLKDQISSMKKHSLCFCLFLDSYQNICVQEVVVKDSSHLLMQQHL